LYYDDPGAAIEWLGRAFGFELRIRVDGEAGQVVHSELTYGEAMFMVSGGRDGAVSPSSLGGKNTQRQFVYVDDVDAHHARASAAGAVVLRPPTDVDYGPDHWADRGYECVDPGGHRWYFAHRLRG
jgi:uncharacterized glyoxalase superfamily protein PhnB